jgi:1,4-dihydroxy-2-naphthoyl-CoA hydrolase
VHRYHPAVTTPPSAAGLGAPGVGPAAGIHGLLGVEMLETTSKRVVLRLPVDWKVHQPYGILHGGVSALLAESAASLGAALAAGPGKGVVGIELNASHLRSLREGHLTATATPVRVGRTLQVWSITLTDDEGRAICAARCTVSVIDAAPVGGDGSVQAPPGTTE